MNIFKYLEVYLAKVQCIFNAVGLEPNAIEVIAFGFAGLSLVVLFFSICICGLCRK